MNNPYSEYTVSVDPVEAKTSVHYGEAVNGRLARFTYRLFRIPSQKRLVVRHFHDATPEDRQHTEGGMQLQGALFYQSRHAANRHRRPDGTFAYHIIGGRFVDDPLVQVELEMMIDLSQALSGSQDDR